MKTEEHPFLFVPFTNSRCGVCGREELNHVHLGVGDDERDKMLDDLLLASAIAAMEPVVLSRLAAMVERGEL